VIAKTATDPPAAKTAIEILQAELLQWKTETIELRAQRDARDKADAERAEKKYLKLKDCARKAGVDYRCAWRWHQRGELDSYIVKGTSEIVAELNDLIARRTRTGRHAKVSQRSK
jgi:hypothetical protein